ncbi:MAG: hypothetical protein H6619_03080 [Deltaproteobacteria bacterium]|nr:hypothetical protein [Deltaproteobacteria bacterium]
MSLQLKLLAFFFLVTLSIPYNSIAGESKDNPILCDFGDGPITLACGNGTALFSVDASASTCAHPDPVTGCGFITFVWRSDCPDAEILLPNGGPQMDFQVGTVDDFGMPAQCRVWVVIRNLTNKTQCERPIKVEECNYDCNGDLGGTAQVDPCGVCGGDGTSCQDCSGTPNGTAQFDQCGICGGDGTSCLDCNGIANGGATIDQCGICGGDGTSCLDCNGVPNGSSIVDQCGICNGDGSSCAEEECIEQQSSEQDIKSAKKVKKKARKLNQRTKKFSNRAKSCGKSYPSLIAKSKNAYSKITELLVDNVVTSTLVCNTSLCTQVSTTELKSKINNQVKKLYKAAKKSKLNYLNDCQVVDNNDNPNAKVTEDYRDDVINATKKLPDTTLDCIN